MRARFKARNTVLHDGREIPYELVRRPRVTRRIYLELGDTGGLRVVAPKQLSAKAVQRLLDERPRAVANFLERARQKRGKRPEYRYGPGEKHLFLGCWYPLRFLGPGDPAPPGFDGRQIALNVRGTDKEAVLGALRGWYRARAAEHFAQRLTHFCAIAPWTGGRVAPLRLRRMKKTMGSCSRTGVITMNPHMVKAPPLLVDKVIAHEVCHLAEHNHGRAFYALMDSLYPDWRAARKQLNENWHLYRAE